MRIEYKNYLLSSLLYILLYYIKFCTITIKRKTKITYILVANINFYTLKFNTPMPN